MAIITDGSAVLGLGDIGPQAAMPVMEGKATLMETLVGLSAIPILLHTKDTDKIVETIVNIAPTFSAIQLEEIMASCDVVIATTGVPGLIKPEMVRQSQIILALSNPIPEIDPEIAMASGAAFAADGKSVNNILGFPGIFRGAVDANVPRITCEMLLAAARTIAESASSRELVPQSPGERAASKGCPSCCSRCPRSRFEPR